MAGLALPSTHPLSSMDLFYGNPWTRVEIVRPGFERPLFGGEFGLAYSQLGSGATIRSTTLAGGFMCDS
jgi:hypothetical protein